MELELIEYTIEVIEYEIEPINYEIEPINYEIEPINYEIEPIEYSIETLVVRESQTKQCKNSARIVQGKYSRKTVNNVY